MTADFLNYRVLGIIDRGECGTFYRVEEINTGKLFVWEPIDYGLLTVNGKALLLKEVQVLKELCHPNLNRCVNLVDHKTTCTIYLMKEFCAGNVATLINKCRSTNSFVDEAFVWKILYQVSRAAQVAYARGSPSMVLDMTAAGILLDDMGNVRLDYYLAFREANSSRNTSKSSSRESEKGRKKSDSWALGAVIYELASLQPAQMQSCKQPRLPPHFSQDLQKLLDLVMNVEVEKRPTIEGVLYHPALVSHVVSDSFQHVTVSNRTQEAFIATNQQNKSSSVSCLQCKDFEKKLTSIHRRETAVKKKEAQLMELERVLVQKNKQIALQERLAKEKLERAKIYSNRIRKSRLDSLGNSSSALDHPNDLDSSSYSADTGDTIEPTSARIDPSRIRRPPSLAPSVSSRRSVRFEPIPEEEPVVPKSPERLAWLDFKRNKYRASKTKVSRYSKNNGKENQPTTPHVIKDKKRESVLSLIHDTCQTSEGLLETYFC